MIDPDMNLWISVRNLIEEHYKQKVEKTYICADCGEHMCNCDWFVLNRKFNDYKQKVRDAREKILTELNQMRNFKDCSEGLIHEVKNTINKYFKELNLGDE